jgi:F420-0:gamma-glutamyl ligase-like protein
VVNTRPTSLGRIDPQSGLQATTGTLGYVTGRVAGLKPNPLAGTGSTRSTTASAPSSPTSSR